MSNITKKDPRLLLGFMVLIFVAVYWMLTSLQSEIREMSDEVTVQARQISRISERLASVALVPEAGVDPSLVWGSAEGATAEQSMQSWLLEMTRENGQTVRQYQQGAQPLVGSKTSVEFRLEFTGALRGLASLVEEIERHRPALAISSLQIRPLPQRDQVEGSTLVATQLSVWGVTDALVE